MSSAAFDQDIEHLKLLSIFHYVVGALAMVVACIPLVHMAIGVGLASGGFDTTEPAARAVGVLIAFVAGVFILAGWGFAVALMVAGRFLATRRHRTYCLVMAAVSCIFMPFGTVLGVLTLIVLMRPSVQALFTDGATGTTEPVGG